MRPKLKVWVTFGDDLKFGDGRAHLLELIDHHGSLRRAAEESVLLEVVAALDDLDRALESARASGAPTSWLEGVTLVAQRLHEGLARRGISVEDPVGRPFDPAFHEAMLEVDAPAGTPPGTVVQVSHKGYRRGERALRPARVVVARAPAGSSS